MRISASSQFFALEDCVTQIDKGNHEDSNLDKFRK